MNNGYYELEGLRDVEKPKPEPGQRVCARCGRVFTPHYPYGEQPDVCYSRVCRAPNYEGEK